MNTQFLTTFVTVVERGSMAAAARLLNITPAAVAQQIRTLERDIGAPLIARAGRTVSVTEAGTRILERSRELLRDVADLRTVANDEATSGELRLGAGTNALTGILPDILVRMVARFPLINVFIKPGYSPELYMAGADPHELLATQPFIRYDRNQWGGHQVNQYLHTVGIKPRERFELNALNAIAVMVDRGLGVSLVPDWARPWPEGLRVVRLPLPRATEPRRVGVLWTRSTIRIRLVMSFLEEAQAAASGHAALAAST